MFRRMLVVAAALAGVTCALNADAPATRPAAGAAQAVPKQLTLTVQEVTLSKPVRVVSEGTQRSVRNLTEFRVSAPEPLPVRALDPVLTVGTTRVTEYRYENGDRTLVFMMYEPARLASDAAEMDVYLQYGDDASSRTALPKLKRADVRRVRR